MPDLSLSEIHLFKSLFKGREDVFAIRWEKDGKKGYTPAYDLDWNEYKIHKAAGGSLKDFKQKQYSKLTDERIANHLNGRETIGIYPLLTEIELPNHHQLHLLRGASHQEELVEQTKALGYGAIAVTDRNTFCGIVRAHEEAKKAGIMIDC